MLGRFKGLQTLPNHSLHRYGIQGTTLVFQSQPSLPFNSRNITQWLKSLKPANGSLKERANARPFDPIAQSDYLNHLSSRRQWEEIKTRFQSGTYAMDPTSHTVYIKALAQLKELDSFKMPEFVQAYYPAHAPSTKQQQTNTTAQSGESTATDQNGAAAPPPDGAPVPPSSSSGGAPVPPSSPSPNFAHGQPYAPIPVQLVESPGTLRSKILWRLFIVGVAVAGLTYLYTTLKDGGGENKIGKGSVLSPFNISNAHSQVTNVTEKFDDVKGCDEAKAELIEVVEYLKNPTKFTRLGARLPKGVLLVGEPGTGKTLLARAIAGEAGVPFLYCAGSSFDEMYIGVGPKRIRNLFEDAKKLGQCIIFIDEIDALGTSRKRGMSSSYSRENTLNQLLTELDGFKQTSGIIIIGATNFPEALDQALVRPGRFDKQIVIPVPDLKGRKEIIDSYLKKTTISPDVDSRTIAKGTPGFTGADLSNLINIAAIKAVVGNKLAVDMRDFEEAKDDVIMGIKRKSGDMSVTARRMTAYHEGGHALVALHTEGAVPVHKATIIKRGNALGMTVQLPDKDTESVSRKDMKATLACIMGGRAAEEIVYGHDEVSSGASSDFKKATQLAHNMVTKWGMSDKIGMMYIDIDKISDEEKKTVDAEVKIILQEAYENARSLLTTHRTELDRIAEALVEMETLSGEELKKVAKGERVKRPF
ncbi:hypothetical protein PROFUN_07475 [Planoprotostelium fungivorum]|uniref:AAA+ ATPase domain-containing protein n=1 Tax=Planoprotostelium fungivorum TaxID=1890364 RepID=A0A2P6NLI5_9EUKA|nr:hypothetical protein PROFUN_07475 [Planoprotostelium fungivorum]